MKNNLLVLLLSILFLPLLAQQPYRLTWPRELALTGGSGVGIGVSLALRPHNKAFTPAQIAALDEANIPGFDHFAVRQYSASAKRASDFMLWGSIVLPTVLLADPAIRRNVPEVAVIGCEVLLLNTALTQLTKELTHRPRPFNYNPDVPMSAKLKRDARLSFFSGHTSTAAAACFATAKIWADHHPSSDWKPVVWVTATAIPLTVGYLRIRAGKHYLSDVLTGFVIGSATGLLIPHWHRSREN